MQHEFFPLLGHIFFWPESVRIYFLLIISWRNFFCFNFSPFPLPLPPYHFSNGPITRRYIHVSFLPCHVLLHSCNHRRSNVKLNDTAVWKKLAFEKLLKCHFTIGIKSMILLIVLTAACWKSSGLRQQYSITVVRLAGHQTTTRP